MEEEKRIGRLTWLTSCRGGDLTFTVFYVKSLWRLKNFEERLPISAVINSPFAGWMFCQIEPVYLDGPRTGSVFSVCTCAAQAADGEHILSNCKALKVTMFVIQTVSFISALNCNS